MGWPPELDSCPHGQTVGYCGACARDRAVDRAVDTDRKKSRQRREEHFKMTKTRHQGARVALTYARKIVREVLQDERELADIDLIDRLRRRLCGRLSERNFCVGGVK